MGHNLVLPITGTLTGDGNRTSDGIIDGTITGKLYQFGKLKPIPLISKLTATFPVGSGKGLLTMTSIGGPLDLIRDTKKYPKIITGIPEG